MQLGIGERAVLVSVGRHLILNNSNGTAHVLRLDPPPG
jgi:hypothetical protein